jgi:hypothetical protein
MLPMGSLSAHAVWAVMAIRNVASMVSVARRALVSLSAVLAEKELMVCLMIILLTFNGLIVDGLMV